ncbi:CGH_1_HP_G0134640.mRNA.1.CDS.1 [Saccharomyces cerevisiae]|nr:CGH_1_HP_G0134640.mRNA.1.CDS.1 [Saccharomyces cerevisiae]CAI6982690.1 CGH_1_HP_G0134640.mRNA.1.CDS.1 [Saccharomyces cerevisiae]
MFVLIDNVLAYLLEQDDLFVTARFAIQGQIVSRRVNKIHISNITDVLLQQFISHTLPYNDNIVPKKILDSMRTAMYGSCWKQLPVSLENAPSSKEVRT